MLCEENNDFVTGYADAHVCAACIGNCQRDELAHHQMEVEGRKVRSKSADDEFQQNKGF